MNRVIMNNGGKTNRLLLIEERFVNPIDVLLVVAE